MILKNLLFKGILLWCYSKDLTLKYGVLKSKPGGQSFIGSKKNSDGFTQGEAVTYKKYCALSSIIYLLGMQFEVIFK